MEDISKKNYFEIFDLEPSLKMNPELTARYMKLQTQYHPDKFITANDNEKLIALSNSSLINKAYDTLKSSIKRIEYFLILTKGIDISNEQGIISDMHKALLIEELEKREALENCEDLGLIMQMINNNNVLMNSLYNELYEKADNYNDEELTLLVLKIKYIHKFLEEAEKKKLSVE